MKTHSIYLLLVTGLFPGPAPAQWSMPGGDFTGELTLGGPVTNTRNPWIWQAGPGKESLDVKESASVTRAGERLWNVEVPVPALPVLLGKTRLTIPAGREGLAPRVSLGRGADGFSLRWGAPGEAEVSLPVTGDRNMEIGTFTFRLQAAGLLRYVSGGAVRYAGLFDDLGGNGLPGEDHMLPPGQTAGVLQAMFAGEGPSWLDDGLPVSGRAGVSRFTDGGLHQVEGVYGVRGVEHSGKLHLHPSDGLPSRWRVLLRVSIEYQ